MQVGHIHLDHSSITLVIDIEGPSLQRPVQWAHVDKFVYLSSEC